MAEERWDGIPGVRPKVLVIPRVQITAGDAINVVMNKPADDAVGASCFQEARRCAKQQPQPPKLFHALRRILRTPPRSGPVRTFAIQTMRWCVLVLGGLLAAPWGHAATVLSGNVSGTWTLSGSPYILSAGCTVLSNQTLTIQPGVEVVIGPAVPFYIYGGIVAVGTPERPIVIRGASPTNYWEIIRMFYSGFTNRFHYSRISDANSPALEFDVDGTHTMNAEVLNCDFVNCRNGGIFGGANVNGPISGSATIIIEVHNSIFDSTRQGCFFFANSGAAIPKITGNIFRNLTGAAIAFYGGTNISRPVVRNNTVVRADRGVSIETAFAEVEIRNNLFIATTNAIYRGGSPSSNPDTSYNCFYGNAVNFGGDFPAIYGVPTQNNHNGSPCDAFFNIFLNPQFFDTNTFLLANNSPCIDAGDPAIADVCPPFSHGSTISDIGAYGGPAACGWLTHGFAPVITGPPSTQSSCVGGGAAFKVSVEGSAPLSYRWYFNTNTLLAGETNAQLNLANLQTNQAGFYSVAVSNTFGSVTSAPARLLVFDACTSISLYAGLSITEIDGRTYVVDASTNIAGPKWVPFPTNTLTTPRWLVVDTNTPLNPMRFFRVRLLP